MTHAHALRTPRRVGIRLGPGALVLAAACLAFVPAAHAQPPVPAAQPDPDRRPDALQPDFTLHALPTTLRVPARKSAFRVTHRFGRPLGQGDLGDLLADAFGLDSGALIGLEFRYGLLPGLQLGIHRTSDRTIQLFGQQNLMTQRDGGPLGLDVLVTLEGDDNLSEHIQSAVGVVVSRNAGGFAALYAEPVVVFNSNPLSAGDSHTLLLGLGARLRMRPQLYSLIEVVPRLAGHEPGAAQITAGIERRAGGHLFQLTVSNGFGTTFGQVARGAPDYDNWRLGFYISRKFFG